MIRVLSTLLLAALLSAQRHEESGRSPKPSGAEHAAEAIEHDEAHPDARMPNETLWKFANFGLLVIGLGYLIKKNAGPFLTARSAEIAQGIAESAKIKADAEARAQDIERRISNLTAEVEALRQSAKTEMAGEASRIQAETAQALDKIQSRAQEEIASSAKAATNNLRSYSASLAIEMATSQLRNCITPEQDHALVDSFIRELDRKGSVN